MLQAKLVRELNAGLWAPEVAGEAAPQMLVGEPAILDSFESPDGRAWVRVYQDGSVLDQHGNCTAFAPHAAEERRLWRELVAA